MLANRGDLQKTRENTQWAKRLAEQLQSDAGLAMAAQGEALILAAAGDKKAAEETYQKCLNLWKKAGWPYYHAKAIIEYSDTADKATARQNLEHASQILSRLGATRTLEILQTKLSTLS